MTRPRVFISTGGAGRDRQAVDVARQLIERCEFGVELSGGGYTDEVDQAIEELAGSRATMLHNYFPPPLEPFVLNLAVPDGPDADLSTELVVRALELSADNGSPYFAVHAGYLASPRVDELGKRIAKREMIDREEGLRLMNRRLEPLASRADELGVRLLVENHVLSEANLDSYGSNFLLLVEPKEILRWHSDLGGQVGFLLDVGHLNVSAATLGFDRDEALRQLSDIAEGYHLSANDGTADAHAALVGGEWFWAGASKDKDFYTVEIHGRDVATWIRSAELTQEWLLGANGTSLGATRDQA